MIITYQDLSKIREEFSGKRIVFCSGSFDIPHAGHVLFLEDCKKNGDILVVAVGSDAILRKSRGNERPVLNEHIRIKTIDSFKPVDFSLLDKNSGDDYSLSFIETVFKELRPDIYVINQDAYDIDFRKKLSEKFNVELIILERLCPQEFEEISATKIINKIKKIA